ncbi:uncharacterized protein BYT42DRAFT_559544 [Radiomyces spectabilis]|uniref:uncharacterized protein n=1 Tax=Radiomyces spectabilis TaxID=64574 RepID=UPI00221E526F|nr:uncharacterized protein BYT42DRAFT_559544 [Radiomyces spectabilis]KAI8388274.1 hypothetical protein BYT42DRAFT_559544 [Radiomyces spectabilis]
MVLHHSQNGIYCTVGEKPSGKIGSEEIGCRKSKATVPFLMAACKLVQDKCVSDCDGAFGVLSNCRCRRIKGRITLDVRLEIFKHQGRQGRQWKQVQVARYGSPTCIFIMSVRQPSSNQQQKNSASKYDFVKVRVHLSEQHYYVLSRFLLCRMLTAARIEYGHALRIALDLKKRLVDKAQLDISQQDLQKELFDLFKDHGYGAAHVQWYKTMASFHHQRIPLVVLLAGTGATGKSTIATRLSERLNLSSVLKTDVIYDLMHTIIDGVIPPRIWDLPEQGRWEQIIDNECSLVCRGLDADLCKSVTDGKSIIIEGELVNHELLDHMQSYIQQKAVGQPVIVTAFLLTISDSVSHRQLISETRNPSNDDHLDAIFQRIQSWQTRLQTINTGREKEGAPSFTTICIEMDKFSASIDLIQSIILQRIAMEMGNTH